MKNFDGIMSYNKMLDETTIILCGGGMPYSELPIITNQSNAMIPVAGKPVIGWILDDLISKKIYQVVVTLREQDHQLKRFIQRLYNKRMNISIVSLGESMTILQSLQTGISNAPPKGLVRIILGDTLIKDTFQNKKDFVYTRIVEDSRRWCLVSIDNNNNKIVDYIDKQETNIQPKIALAGYYHLIHGFFLQECLIKAIDEGKKQISDVLKYYNIKYPIEIRNANEWYDFGHIEKLQDARNRLLPHRYFNSLHIDPVLSTITKISEKNEKLEDELNWYFQIPDALKILSPRIVNYSNSGNRVKIISEYYGYPTLAELYVYGDIQIDYWILILKSIFRIHKQFQQYSGELEAHFVEKMYLTKTFDRYNELSHQDEYWEKLLALDTINFNGSNLHNFNALKDLFIIKAKTIIESSRICAIHGDLCFSNILFDINNWITRLIDPRGSFGQRGIYGDPRYDIAKLRHSISSCYDFIMADMFYIEKTTNGFTGCIYSNDNCSKIADEFDKMVCEQKYDLDEIVFIEAILFISMAALHKDHPDRQLIMYLTGLKLLNEVLQ